MVSIGVIVVALSFGFNEGTERIVGVILYGFQNVPHWSTLFLVRIETDVDSVRKVIGINRHAFQKSVIVNENSYLGIVGFSKV